MSEAAVSVQSLGKLFRHSLPRYRTLLGRLRRCFVQDLPSAEVWALKDVSFELNRGECLGISGPNGAGKSTLLAVIAGILEPSEGTVRLQGRVNTFFNLSAGLQSELSVRDNIEIRGILMGLRRREVLRRTEAILDFAELPDLAEVRMGELSSGQAARIAFAAAVLCDHDILLVDEALSVGDRSFQEKCLQAFHRLRQEGKTLLVVSHDEQLLRDLDSRLLRLRAGKVEP